MSYLSRELVLDILLRVVAFVYWVSIMSISDGVIALLLEFSFSKYMGGISELYLLSANSFKLT